MQKYDVQQLLRQQKISLIQSILTIFLAVLLGISSTIIFEHYEDFLTNGLMFYSALIIIFLLIFIPIFHVLLHQNDSIKIKKEKFTILIILDLENNSIKPIQIPDYNFSVEFENKWKSVIGNNDEYIKKFKEAHSLNQNPTFIYSEYFYPSFDYKVITDLIQYLVLQKISLNKNQNKTKHGRYFNKWIPSFDFWFHNIIVKYLRKINFVDVYYKKKNALYELELFSDGKPIIFQLQQIQNNLFVQERHEKQIEYETEILKGEKHRDSYSLLPFYLFFPKGVELNLDKSDNSALNKIILSSKYGTLTIEFFDRWKYHSQKAFFYTNMKPGHRHHRYEEIFFELTVNLEIKKYAFFPLIGGSEGAVDEFFDWANQIIENLKKSYDWEYHEEHLTRDLFQRLNNQLDWHNWEDKIEYYSNFDDTENGNFQKILRKTISPHFEWRRNALNEIIEKKEEIPSDKLTIVVLRVLRLTYYNENVTRFKAVETIGKLSDKIPIELHENVIDRLIQLTDDEDDIVFKNSLESIESLFDYIDVNLKMKTVNKILHLFFNSELLSWKYLQSIKFFHNIYLNIMKNERERLENYYLEILKSNNNEIAHALRFFTGVRGSISNEKIKEVLEITLKIETFDSNLVSEILEFLASFSGIVPNELVLNYYEKLSSFLEHDDVQIRNQTIFYLRKLSRFLEILDETKKEILYQKIRKFAFSEDKVQRNMTLESLSFIAEHFTGKEEEIVEIIMNEIETIEGQFAFNDPLILSAFSCFEKLKEKIIDKSIKERVTNFQKKISN